MYTNFFVQKKAVINVPMTLRIANFILSRNLNIDVSMNVDSEN